MYSYPHIGTLFIQPSPDPFIKPINRQDISLYMNTAESMGKITMSCPFKSSFIGDIEKCWCGVI